ncbi:restriction endonuclease subunit S [Vibrio furnissii]
MKVNGWKTCKVDDIFLLKGGSAFKEKYQGQLRGEYPFIKVSDFNLPNNKMFITSANNWISKEVKNALKPNIFPNNTIVFAKVGAALSSNRRRILTRNTAIDNNMMGAIPKDIDPLFGYYVFCTIDFNKFVQDGAVPSVNQKQIGNVFVYIPESTSEQQKIAEVLLTVDKRINLIDQKIAETEKLKTGLMQKLFSEGIGVQDADGNWQPHAEFSSDLLPSSWEVGEVIDFLELQRGHDLPVQKRMGGSVPIIGSNGIAGYHSQAVVEESGVITGRSGTLGKVYFSEGSFWPLNTSLYIRDFKGNNKKYCFYFLEHFNLKRFGTGTGVPTLNRNIVHKQKTAFPSLIEQEKIAEILDTVSQKKQILEQQKAETQQLKKGLMQKLLTGEWRVPVEETEAA